MRKFFGTDGIRGEAGKAPLDPETVSRVGKSLGVTLNLQDKSPRVLIGRDTRESGEWIEDCLGDGLRSMGVEVHGGGVLPTPAVAGLVKQMGYDGGVMISASHNPFEDNGIKIFSSSGFKLPDTRELELEKLMEENNFPIMTPVNGSTSPTSPDEFRRHYLDLLRSALMAGVTLDGIRLVLDCSNGAASGLAADLYRSLGAEVTSHFDAPDGRNINLDCGSLHTDQLAKIVTTQKADIGIAFDGDADRAIFIDSNGSLVDGDHVLFLCGRHLKTHGLLRDSHIVTTVMANIGLERALEKEEITMDRTQVGDKYVLEQMIERDCVLGGEQSGHIIFLHRATTGDGLLTGLKVLEVMAKSGRPLHELAHPMVKFPQLLVNFPVASKPPLETMPGVTDKIGEVETMLGDKGRVLVRYSGTENLARVMVEGPSREVVTRHAHEIAATMKRCIEKVAGS